MKELQRIQKLIKAPKEKQDSEGGFNYRHVDDIIEALKKINSEHNINVIVTLTDKVKHVGEFTFIEAKAIIKNETGETEEAKGQAGVKERSNMDIGQSFNASSSYARKKALEGLLLIDNSSSGEVKEDNKPEINVKQPELP